MRSVKAARRRRASELTARVADVATPIAVWGVALVLIPVLSVGIALRFLRDRPQALYAFFYGVEAPLMLLAAVRLFILRDLPAHAAMLYTAALIGLAALAIEILFGRKERTSRAVLAARAAGRYCGDGGRGVDWALRGRGAATAARCVRDAGRRGGGGPGER